MSETTKLDWPLLITEAVTREGKVAAFYSAFHEYSFLNRLMFAMQGIYEPVASASRWKELGRTKIDGAKPKQVVVPKIVKVPAPKTDEDAPEPPDAKRAMVERLIGYKVVKAIFALSDTEGEKPPAIETPGWGLAPALDKLGIREVPFNNTDGNLQGWSKGTEFGINPIAANPVKTRFHEIAHIILGHTLAHHYEEYQAHRGVVEFQAEATAYLAMHELDLLDDEAAAESRGYIQHWLHNAMPPDKAIQQVFTATDRILRAGREDR